MQNRREARIAVVHPWYLAYGGAEAVVEALATLLPNAEFVTIFSDPKCLPEKLRSRVLRSSSLNFLPGKYLYYRHLLGLLPFLFESMDLSTYDIVVTSDSAVAKGVLVAEGATHICYCHSPMRALWDSRWEFRNLVPFFVRPIYDVVTNYLRMWDFFAAQRVDHFVANSEAVAQRIRRYYGREAKVIYPPVNLPQQSSSQEREDFYLSVARLTPTKRIDLAIHACNQLGRKLVVVGTGRHLKYLEQIAGPTITFRGFVSPEERSHLYRTCRAVIAVSDEDFGIVPVEAQAHGSPVIALGLGGTRETVIPLSTCSITDSGAKFATGVYCSAQTTDALVDAILEFEKVESKFSEDVIRSNAERFGAREFARQISELVHQVAHERGVEVAISSS